MTDELAMNAAQWDLLQKACDLKTDPIVLAELAWQDGVFRLGEVRDAAIRNPSLPQKAWERSVALSRECICYQAWRNPGLDLYLLNWSQSQERLEDLLSQAATYLHETWDSHAAACILPHLRLWWLNAKVGPMAHYLLRRTAYGGLRESKDFMLVVLRLLPHYQPADDLDWGYYTDLLAWCEGTSELPEKEKPRRYKDLYELARSGSRTLNPINTGLVTFMEEELAGKEDSIRNLFEDVPKWNT